MNQRITFSNRGRMLVDNSKNNYDMDKKPAIITDYSSRKPTKTEQKEAESSLLLLKQKMRVTLAKATTLDERAPYSNDYYNIDHKQNNIMGRKAPVTQQNINDRPSDGYANIPRNGNGVYRDDRGMDNSNLVSKARYGNDVGGTRPNRNTMGDRRDGNKGEYDNDSYSVNKYVDSSMHGTKPNTTNNTRQVREPPKQSFKEERKGFNSKGYNFNLDDEDDDTQSQPVHNRNKNNPATGSRKPETKPPVPSKPTNTKTVQYDNITPDDVPIRQNRQQFDVPSEPEEEIQLVKCPEGCGKSFRPDVVKKHAKVCKKVFQQKRKEFNMAEQRQPDELKEFQNENKYKKKPQGKQPAKPKAKEGVIPKWKLQSAMLRNGIRAVAGNNTKDTEEAKIAQKYEEQEMVRCHFCNRTFNNEAGKRHMPFCEKKAKESKLKGAPLKKTVTAPVKKR